MAGGPGGRAADFLIMPASEADAPAIATVWHRSALVGYEGIFPPTAPPPTLQALTARTRKAIASQGRHGMVLVACRNDPDRTVVGTVTAVADPREGSRARIQRLYVDPGYWGRGIGRGLHDRALEHLEDAGFRVVVLWVLERNVRARAAYERWGWRPTPGRHSPYPGVVEVCYLLML
jgi:RimJ/RimL family protein N-acetyltransferase